LIEMLAEPLSDHEPAYRKLKKRIVLGIDLPFKARWA